MNSKNYTVSKRGSNMFKFSFLPKQNQYQVEQLESIYIFVGPKSLQTLPHSILKA